MRDKAYYIIIGSVFGLFGKVLYELIPIIILKLFQYPSVTTEEFVIVFFKGIVGMEMSCMLYLSPNMLFRNQKNNNSNTSRSVQ